MRERYCRNGQKALTLTESWPFGDELERFRRGLMGSSGEDQLGPLRKPAETWNKNDILIEIQIIKIHIFDKNVIYSAQVLGSDGSPGTRDPERVFGKQLDAKFTRKAKRRLNEVGGESGGRLSRRRSAPH
jgi:hypothetical protein